MSLDVGTNLGPYSITGTLGAGGMGEVYKAKDTRLDRTVAIKVLPSELSQHEELRRRFEQEARAVSSLNHPHICTLYDIGHEDGIDFMVMEYLEGETLADRLTKGPLPVEEALAYAKEVAGALHQAHRAGVVHRDVKPGNIVVTKGGTKLLDFGLARMSESSRRSVGEGSSVATEAKPLTQEGTILGTFQYMAPEQLEGQETDARTDIFAFGAVLYEMLTGRKAFEGKSQASLITAIMSAEPPAPSSLRPVTPKQLDDAIARCVAKDPDARWQSAGDLAWELGRVGKGASETTRPGARSRLSWMVSALAGLSALVFFGLWRSEKTPESRPIVRASILPPEGVWYGNGFALSPDGRALVFSMVEADGTNVLGIRALDAMDTRVLEGTEGGRAPFWSPDSRRIGFFADRRLKTIAVDGGPSQSLAGVPTGWSSSGTWSQRGVILFQSGAGPIYSIPEKGGTPTALTVVDRGGGEIGHFNPRFLADGAHFFYQPFSQGDVPRVVHVASIDEPTRSREVLADVGFVGMNPVQYVEPGYVAFLDRDMTLNVQGFDDARLELTGPRTPIVRDVYSPEGFAMFAIARNGTLVYSLAPSEWRDVLRWRDRDGVLQEELGRTWTFGLSHDGRRVALNQGGMQLLTAGRSGLTELGQGATEIEPVFSPDDRYVLYHRTAEEGLAVIIRAVDRVEETTLRLPSNEGVIPSDWSPDGKSVVLSAPSTELGGSYDVWLYSVDEGSIKPLVSSDANERGGVISPDGNALAYQSDESGVYDIYVLPLSGSGARARVSSGGGRNPEWRQDGSELFYLRPDGAIMAVAVENERVFGEPKELFKVRTKPSEWYDFFDVSPNGQRFLVMEQTREAEPLTLIQNWPSLLER